jgi:hypothetical protein
MAENTIDFNPIFNIDVANELNDRTSAASGVTRDDFFRYWNYKKYCYVNISIKANVSGTAIVPTTSLVIGDNTAPVGKFTTPTKGGLDMYTSEGGSGNGSRKPKPVLTSVKILNQGSEDYTEAAIYEIEASFKVYTLDDLEEVEKTFFIIGAEMVVNFGWGLHPKNKKGITNDSISSNIYNFSFSIDSDGSYNCNVKAISGAALFSKSMGGVVQAAPEAEGDTSVPDTKTDIISQLIREYKNTFGISEDGDPSDGDAKDGKILKMQSKGDNTNGVKLDLYTGNIEDGTPWYNIFEGDSVYFSYIRLGSLIEYLNKYFESELDKSIKFTFAPNAAGGYPNITGFASADPGKFVLDGDMARYNDAGGSLDWSGILKYDPPNRLENIIISIELLQKFYNELSTNNDSSATMSPKVTNLLNKIFNEIDVNTGGLITPKLLPAELNPSAIDSKVTQEMYIINRKTVTDNAPYKPPYKFSVIGETSIVRSVSLESDYTSDLLILASKQAIQEGTSNTSQLQVAYPENAALNATIKKATENEDQTKKVTPDTLTTQKLAFGKDGYTSDKISAYRQSMQTYINKNFKTDALLSKAGYSELPLMLKLGVTIDGIAGITFLSPITIDRLPKRFNDNENLSFGVTAVEHTFDGQGDWETRLETVMRLK